MSRSQDRETCEIEAMILTADAPPIRCMVVDISKQGAGLRLPTDLMLPADFRVRGALDTSTASDGEIVERTARLRWQRDGQAGVLFL